MDLNNHPVLLVMAVAITEIGVRTGRMQTDIAAALVGAGMLSVVLFPAIAGVLRFRGAAQVLSHD